MEHIFKKKYGQNFLNDQNILSKIASTINPNSNDLIIEIGPGSGNLTKHLQKFNCYLLCYEIDLSLKPFLDNLLNNKTKIIYKDFLNTNIEEDIQNIPYENIYIVANIPYYITTPIIEKLALSNLNIKSLTLMMQKEVGQRLTAKPKTKDYGYITVFLNYFYNIKCEFEVSRKCFYPMPNVDSIVVKFETKQLQLTDFHIFNNFIKNAFQYKRKNLRNNLKSYDLNKIDSILNKYGYTLNNRAEDLPLDVFINIVNNL